MAELPHVGTPMYLVHSEETNYRSRLEAVEGGMLSVSAPLETADAQNAPRPGAEIEIFWAQPRARVILPCRLVKIADSAPYQWILEPIGTPEPSNRREYVRGGGGPPVRLADDEEEQMQSGRLIDISEGGLRAWVLNATDISVGDRMRAALRLDTGQVDIDGVVHTVRPAFDEPGYQVILQFQADETTSRLIRQHVFAWEIAERQREAS